MNTPTQAIADACEVVGGQAELARLLDLTPSAVNQWCRGLREVPAERCPQIEEQTRLRGKAVPCESLRPDVRWEVLRAVPHPTTEAAAPEGASATTAPEAAHG